MSESVTKDIALRLLREREEKKSQLRRLIVNITRRRHHYPTDLYQELLNSYFDQLKAL